MTPEQADSRDVMLGAIQALTPEQYERARLILEKVIKPEVWKDVWDMMRMKPENWWSPFHFGWGMWVRNQLRVAGFEDKESKSGNLDDIYISLVEYTAKKVVKAEVPNDLLVNTALTYLMRVHGIPASTALEYEKAVKALKKFRDVLRRGEAGRG
jgi:hypothetical protein